MVFVADCCNNRVQVLNSDLTFSHTFGGSFGKEQEQFIHTHDVAIDSKGFVFVNDCLDNRILKFTTEGQFVSLFKSDIPFPSGIQYSR